MKKQGFVSMTLVYTFLVLFLFLMLAVLNAYTQQNKFLQAIDEHINVSVTTPNKYDYCPYAGGQEWVFDYTGKEQTPKIEINDNNITLVEDKDYTVVYINNINIGQAKVNITGIGNYSGNVIKTFNIKQAESKEINSSDISSIENQIYTGYKITPNVEIKNNNSILKKDQDYILTYQNNINVGDAEIIIQGVGNYSGTITKNFKITPKSITEVNISSIEKQIYTGTEIKPNIQISDGSSKLVLDNCFCHGIMSLMSICIGLNNY